MPVTLVIIGICVVSWLLQLVTGGAWTQALAFWPGIGLHEPWRFLTAAFLHSTMPMHIMFNMYALFITGQFLEPVLGRARYITLCLLAAIGGSVGVVLLTSPTASPQGFITWGPAVVGASGMVFGLFGAMIPVLRRLGNNAYQIIGVIAINAAIGFLVSGIAWQAHAGGLVVGLALGYGYAHAPRDKRQLVGWLLPTGIVAVLIAITLIRYTQTGWIHTL
jgi:membrane associated rhomboid family serine protease